MADIYFEESGSGFPLVLIHGFCETSFIWKRFREALSDEFRVITPDLPGFGKSPLCPTPFRLSDIADQLEEWLSGLNIPAGVVIGHSLGGYITLELARRHRSRLAGFGLFNSSAFPDTPEKRENRNKLIEFIEKEGVAPFIKTFVPSLFYPPTVSRHEEVISKIKDIGTKTGKKTVIAYSAAMRDRNDNTELLKANREDVLLISGAEDQNVPLAAAREMARWLVPENVHILDATAHMSMFEKEEETMKIVRTFTRKMRDLRA